MKSLFWKNESSQLKTLQQTHSIKIETGATLTYIDDLKVFLFLGGLKQDLEKKQSAPPVKKNPFATKSSNVTQQKVFQIQEVHIYSPQSKVWEVQKCTGKIPPQRIYHYVNYNSPFLLLYGGMDKKMYSDIYILNCHTWVWKKLVVLDSHVPRLYGCLIPYINKKNNKRFLIGGTGSIQNVDILSDIWMLSLQGVIDSNNNELPGAIWTKIDYKNINQSFVPIKNFTANVIEQDKAFIFGGFVSNQKSSNNGYIFEMKNNDYRIKLLESKGVKPSPRGNHKSTLIKSDFVVIYGGQHNPSEKNELQDIFVYHININTWEKVIPGGNSPTNLSSLCISSSTNNNKGQLILLCSTKSNETCQYTLQQLVQEVEYRVISNSSIISEKQNNNVSEDLKQGYQLSQEQKIKIQQLEGKLQHIRQKNAHLKQKIQKVRTSPLPASQRFSGNKTQLSSRLLNLLLLEHKKRKFLQLKSVMLQNTIKDAQKLVVLLDGFSQPDAKIQHIKTMKDYRIEMQQIWNKEKVLRKQINSKKNVMGLDIAKLFVESLSQQENSLLSLL